MDARHINIINNIKLATQHRGGVLANMINEDKLLSIFNTKGYYLVPAKREKDPVRCDAGICYAFVSKNSKAYAASADYEKLISNMVQVTPTSDNYELIIVFEDNNGSGLDMKACKIMEKTPNYYIKNTTSIKFVIDVRAHSRSSVHTIVDKSEIDEFCANSKCLSSSFPQIIDTDSQAIWLGARPGMFIRIERICENAGVTTVYRKCVKG